MKILLTALLLTASVSASFAQERAAAGSLENQMTWSALSAKVDGALKHSEGVDFKVNQIITCNNKGMAYAPTVKGKDGDGCIKVGEDLTSLKKLVKDLADCNAQGKLFQNGKCEGVDTLSTLKTQLVSGSICEGAGTSYRGTADTNKNVNGFSVYTKKVSCPAGWKLLACSGGPGDQLEKGEGSYIRPVAKDSCELVIGEPACSNDLYWTHSWVFAHCAKID